MPKSYEIYPSIGIARVGNSQEFFLGPEPDLAPPTQYRDTTGKLKRQAARFRVFECQRDQNGKLTQATEVDLTQVTITWTVHLINRKAAAPKFASGAGNRNNATGNDVTDKNLIIDPGSRSVIGINQPQVLLNTGKFMGTTVPLGSIETDAKGRLIVLGGFGKSDSVPGQPNLSHPLQGFADSDNWYDDTSDGPVTALLKFANDGHTEEAKAAWVIVGPPDFAPEVYNMVTLYDAIYQAAVEKGWLSVPNPVLFTKHVQPILSRGVGYQWVNKTNRQGHSGNHPGNFDAHLAQLANPATSVPLAQTILQRMRNPNIAAPPTPVPATAMPRLHDETNSSQVLPLTKTQYAILQNWANGNYTNDFGVPPPQNTELFAESLTRVALEACSGGAFFPGIEVGRIVKNPAIYSEAFRFNAPTLKAGQITQGNALPWQADFYDCRWEAQSFIGWWPAQRPDHVFTQNSPTFQKDWARGISSNLDLVANWHRLGVVVKQIVGSSTTFLEVERDPTFPPV